MFISRRELLHLLTYGFGTVLLAACRHRPDDPPPARAALTAMPGLTPIVVIHALQALGFAAFADSVKLYQDERYLYVESNGLPAHPMMSGIRSWQQQVPLPQPYVGRNAWQIPRHPVLAEQPISARHALYRGAIALAVNGVPIFNALNNRGDDAYLFGELDEWGGHAGRADDYHYHIAPLHLTEIVGIDKPIAYALDGFPLYGLTEADGSPVTDLDEFNGHFGPDGSYHYHATKTFPYINGGLRGVVAVRDDQIDPQPRTIPIRPSLQPLRGAVVTDFQVLGDNAYTLEYQIKGLKYYVNYQIEGKDYTFEFIDATGQKRMKTYRSRGS